MANGAAFYDGAGDPVRFSLLALALLPITTAPGQEAGAPACAALRGFVYKIAFYGPRRPARPEGFGAGFFLRRDGTFVTALHLFEEASAAVRAVVEITDGPHWTECPVDSVLAASHSLDVALVQVRLASRAVLVPPLSDSLREGDPVFGFRVAPPLAPSWRPFTGIVCTTGVISALDPQSITVQGEQFFVPGSSGSPVFDAAGRALAIAIEMRNGTNSGPPEWTYGALRIQAALSLRRLPAPVPVSAFLKRLRGGRPDL